MAGGPGVLTASSPRGFARGQVRSSDELWLRETPRTPLESRQGLGPLTWWPGGLSLRSRHRAQNHRAAAREMGPVSEPGGGRGGAGCGAWRCGGRGGGAVLKSPPAPSGRLPAARRLLADLRGQSQ